MKTRIKSIIFAIVCFFTIGGICTAQAQIKFGTSETASAIMSNIQKAEEWVQNQVNTASQKMQELITGPKIQAAAEKVRALKESITSAANTIQDTYDDISDSVDTVSEDVSGVNDSVDDVKQTDTISTANLTVQLNNINQQIEDYKTSVLEEMSAKIQATQDNYAVLQAMYDASEDEADKALLAAEMSSLQEEIDSYNALLSQIENDGGEEYLSGDSEYQDLLSQRDDIENQLKETAAESTSSFFQNMFSKTDAEKQEEYNEVINNNFLQEGEVNTVENIARITQYRRDVFKKDIAYVLYTAMKLKLQLDEDLERIETKQENMAAADYKMTAGNLLVEQRIEDIKILYNYTNLLIADLRLKTSQNMLNQDYRLKNYDKNPAALNLDNYIFTEDDIPSDEGQESFLDSVTAN